MIKQPNEVLSYFIESLEQEKQFEFNMNHWFQTEDFSLSEPYAVENTCGTSACIAGTVAYRLNPKSDISCQTLIEQWIGCPEDEYTYTDEHDYVESVLDDIFSSALLYGEVELIDITKEQALTLLNRLLNKSHETWESLYNSISDIKWSNL